MMSVRKSATWSLIFWSWLVLQPSALFAQSEKVDVPRVLTNIEKYEGGLVVTTDNLLISQLSDEPQYTLDQLIGNPAGSAKGIIFDFQKPDLNGKVYYGFIPVGDSDHPLPVYFKYSAELLGGRSFINIKDQMRGRYDMVGWEKSGKGTLGYRVVDNKGNLLYDGKVSFKGKGPFKVDVTALEGPFVNMVTPEGAMICFRTNLETKGAVTLAGKEFGDAAATKKHEILLTGLEPATEYAYQIHYGDNASQAFTFKTAPNPGTRSAFTFAYASDSRNGQGGGERNLYGANFYIVKKIMALASYKESAFMQFSGDLIDGYLSSPDEIRLQYANWKRAIEPFAHQLPVYLSMGNHEVLLREFAARTEAGIKSFRVDRFPYETESSEAVFADVFVNPVNGPESEDGASYDPQKKKVNFPSYRENVFFYTYDNIAMIVLNSNYWFTPSITTLPETGGNPHGYVMDQQFAWFAKTLDSLENRSDIDHIFLTLHTPFFPNGGHVTDDMWYNGNNDIRPYVNGKALEFGILERRDQLLDQLVNHSEKVIAILTGDEHNYARTEIGPGMKFYPENYEGSTIELGRTIYQINNGAAGAPYYAQEQTPWTPRVSGFTTQNALVFFHVEGDKVWMEVLNPDTLEEVDRLELR